MFSILVYILILYWYIYISMHLVGGASSSYGR
jgi:hypothetical protein